MWKGNDSGTHIPWKNQLKMGLSMSRVVSQMEMFLAYDKRVARPATT